MKWNQKKLEKMLRNGFRRLQREDWANDIWNIFEVFQTLGVGEDSKRKLRALRVMISILGTFTSESTVAERGFSVLNRIRTDTRNRLSGDNLSAVMCVRLAGEVPSPE